MNCEYVRKFYGVPAEIGLRIKWKGRLGTIYKDGGNYVNVNLDDEKPGECYNIHPTDPNLEYLKEKAELRIPKLTRSQQRYQDYLHSEVCESFAEWLGIDKQK